MLRFFLSLFLVAGISNLVSAQPTNWIWANTAADAGTDQARAMAVDPNGNVYVTGTFNGASITFGSTTLTNPNTSGNSYEFFLVKYDPAGVVQWVRQVGGTDDENGTAINYAPNGSIRVTGTFTSTSITLGSTTLTNGGGSDFFVAEYDLSGNVNWAKRFGGSSYETPWGICSDASSNIYITGTFLSPSLAIGTTTLTQTAQGDVFTAKLDAAGTTVWAQKIGGGNSDCGYGIAVDASGNVCICGYFRSATFTFASTTLTNPMNGIYQGFTAKYNSSGGEQWINYEKGSAGMNVTNDICVNAAGDVYVTGRFESDTLWLGTTLLMNAASSNNSEDIYLVKYDAAGNLVWGQQIGGTTEDVPWTVSLDPNENVFVGGDFSSSTMNVGTFQLQNSSVSCGDLFFAGFSPNGTAFSAYSEGGTGCESVYGMEVNSNFLYVCGWFFSPSIVFSSTTLNNSGLGDVFIAKMELPLSVTTTEAAKELTVFPNPGDGYFYFESEKRIASVEIFNSSGQVVYSENQESANLAIDLSAQPGGLYFFILHNEDGSSRQGKLVVR